MRRVSHRARNPANQADDAERALIEWMQAELKSGATLQPTVLDNLVVINKLYPADAAISFSLGDLRGLWRIDFSRAALAEEP